MKRKHKGSSLVLALGISLSLLILIMAVSTTLSAETKTSVNQQKKIQAYYIARGGAEAAAEWIKQQSNLSFPIESNNNSFENGSFDLDIREDEIDSNKIIIKSTGKVNNTANSDGNISYITDTASLVLTSNSSTSSNISDIKYAVFGINKVTNLSTINGDVGTNSSTNPIELGDGFKKTNNSIYYTYGSSVNYVKSGSQTIYNYLPSVRLSSPLSYPSPNFEMYPNDLITKPDILLNGGEPNNGSHYSISGDAYYDTITVTANRFLQINTNNHDTTIRIKNFDVQQGRIIINGSGKLTLFIDNLINLKGTVNKDGSVNNSNQLLMYCNTNSGSLKLDNGVYINASIYIGNSSINITGGATINGNIVTTSNNLKMDGGSSTLLGIIYAPNANINLTGGAKITGAVIGNIATLENGGAIVTYNSSAKLDVNSLNNSSTITTYVKNHWQ